MCVSAEFASATYGRKTLAQKRSLYFDQRAILNLEIDYKYVHDQNMRAVSVGSIIELYSRQERWHETSEGGAPSLMM